MSCYISKFWPKSRKNKEEKIFSPYGENADMIDKLWQIWNCLQTTFFL